MKGIDELKKSIINKEIEEHDWEEILVAIKK